MALVSALRATFPGLAMLIDWLEDSWIGDLIGVLALFFGLWMALVFGWAVQ